MAAENQDGTHSASPRSRAVAAYAVSTAALCVTALVIAWLVSTDIPGALTEVDPSPVAVTAPVTEDAIRYATEATVDVTYAPVQPIVAPEQGGTVTDVYIRSGDALSAMDRVYAVDGHMVLAYEGEVFYRDLALGMEGADVAQLQVILAAALPDWQVVSDGQFGATTEAALKEWQRGQGMEEPIGTFPASTFVRLPSVPFVVDDVKIQSGRPVPPAGDDIASAQPWITAGDVTPAESFEGPAGLYTFAVSGRSATFDFDGATWTAVDQEAVRVLVPPPDEGDSATADGVVQFVDAQTGLRVPASAIIMGSEGTCVAVEGAVPDTFGFVAVKTGESSADGTVVVEGPLNVGEQVLMNPFEVLEVDECPSR